MDVLSRSDCDLKKDSEWKAGTEVQTEGVEGWGRQEASLSVSVPLKRSGEQGKGWKGCRVKEEILPDCTRC